MIGGQGALELDIDPNERAMAKHSLRFIADPLPWPRAGTRIVTPREGKPFVQFYDPVDAVRYKDALGISWKARAAHTGPLEGPLAVCLLFCFARPDGHYAAAGGVKSRFLASTPGKGGKNGQGERTGGDIDNCTKTVLDALNEIAYADDGQICELRATKTYLTETGWLEPCTIIELWAL